MGSKTCLIVGGGVIGLMTAWRFAGAGWQVRLIEAGRIGEGASRAAAGMLCPEFEAAEYPAQAAQSLLRLGRQSAAIWRDVAAELREEVKVDIDYRPFGAVGLTKPGADRPDGSAGLSPARQAQMAFLLAPDTDTDKLYLWAEEGQIDPIPTLSALRRAAEQRGVLIEEGMRVCDVELHGYEAALRLANGTVRQADILVLATGSRVDTLWQEGGPFPFLPVKGQAISVRPADTGPWGDVPVLRLPGAYICPKSDGRIVIGATEEPDSDDLDVDHAMTDALLARATRWVPSLSGAAVDARWAGIRPGTVDRLPVIGRSAKAENLLYGVGHYRNGVLLAPLTAQLLVGLAQGNEGPAAFSPGRF